MLHHDCYGYPVGEDYPVPGNHPVSFPPRGPGIAGETEAKHAAYKNRTGIAA